MTGYGLLAALLWALVVLVVGWRLERVVRLWMAQHAPAIASVPLMAADIPEDLVAYALAETEKWAQDQTLATIRQRYDTLQDWPRVRASLGVGALSV